MSTDTWRDNLRGDVLFPALTAGSLTTVMSVMVATSLSVLIFSDRLAPFVPVAIGMAFLGGLLVRLVVALRGAIPGTISTPLTEQLVILAVVTANLQKHIATEPGEAILLVTAIAAIILTTAATGGFLIALGWLRLGGLVRFIPYPVIGGFLAGTGWLMFRGSFQVMTGVATSFEQLPRYLETELLLQWLPGLGCAVLLLVLTRKIKHYLTLPVLLLASVGVFYLALLVSGTSQAEAGSLGLLLGPFPEGNFIPPLTLESPFQIDFAAIFREAGNIGTIMMITVLSLLLNASGLELVARGDIDLNRELRVVGTANLTSALGAGMPGSHALPLSALSYTMGAATRLTGIFGAAVYVLILWVGPAFLSYVPRFVLGSLILFLGVNLLIQWLAQTRTKLPRAEYLVVVLIVVVIGLFGFLAGVGVGLLAAVILFALEHSRVDITRYAHSGAILRSNVDRPVHERQILEEKGEQIFVLKLQSFIFFGTANNLVTEIKERLADENLQPVRYLVLDFELVQGLDSSAVLSFVKIDQLSEKHGFRTVFSGLREPMIEPQLRQGDAMGSGEREVHIETDLDHALEWCEIDLIAKSGSGGEERSEELLEALAEIFVSPAESARFLEFLQGRTFERGQYVFRQGDAADGLYFVERGQVSILLPLDAGRVKRLRTFHAGSIIGEMGLYSNSPRSADVVADVDCRLLHLSLDAFTRMEREVPALSAAFHKFTVNLLTLRLRKMAAEIERDQTRN